MVNTGDEKVGRVRGWRGDEKVGTGIVFCVRIRLSLQRGTRIAALPIVVDVVPASAIKNKPSNRQKCVPFGATDCIESDCQWREVTETRNFTGRSLKPTSPGGEWSRIATRVERHSQAL